MARRKPGAGDPNAQARGQAQTPSAAESESAPAAARHDDAPGAGAEAPGAESRDLGPRAEAGHDRAQLATAADLSGEGPAGSAQGLPTGASAATRDRAASAAAEPQGQDSGSAGGGDGGVAGQGGEESLLPRESREGGDGAGLGMETRVGPGGAATGTPGAGAPGVPGGIHEPEQGQPGHGTDSRPLVPAQPGEHTTDSTVQAAAVAAASGAAATEPGVGAAGGVEGQDVLDAFLNRRKMSLSLSRQGAGPQAAPSSSVDSSRAALARPRGTGSSAAPRPEVGGAGSGQASSGPSAAAEPRAGGAEKQPSRPAPGGRGSRAGGGWSLSQLIAPARPRKSGGSRTTQGAEDAQGGQESSDYDSTSTEDDSDEEEDEGEEEREGEEEDEEEEGEEEDEDATGAGEVDEEHGAGGAEGEEDVRRQLRREAQEREAEQAAQRQRAAAAAEAQAVESAAAAAAREAQGERVALLQRLTQERDALLRAAAETQQKQAAEVASLSSAVAALAEDLGAEQQRHGAWRRQAAEEEAALEGRNADRARMLAAAQHSLDQQVLLLGVARAALEDVQKQLRDAREATEAFEAAAQAKRQQGSVGRHGGQGVVEARSSPGAAAPDEHGAHSPEQLALEGGAADGARGREGSVGSGVQQLRERAEALQAEVQALASEGAGAGAGAFSAEEQELERSLQQLTDHLLLKQAQVEALHGEKASLTMRLERETKGLQDDRATASSPSALRTKALLAQGRTPWGEGAEGDEEAGVSRTSLLNHSRKLALAQRDHGLGPLGNRVVFHVAEALLGLDTLLVGSASVLRTNWTARAFLWGYFLLLHVWVAFVWLMHAHLLPF